MLDDEARSEIEAARGRARERSPRRESPPDPTALPFLPPSPLEQPEAAAARVGEHIPDDYLYNPSPSLPVWTDIWERDVRFQMSSHRGLLGRLLVLLKRALSPLVRAPLADVLQRERIFSIVLLRHLEQHTAEVQKHLRDVRDPYSFVRDWAIPDLIARGDALFSILDRRLDLVEATLGAGAVDRRALAPDLAAEAAEALRERKGVLAVAGAEVDPLLRALDAAGIALERPPGDLETELRARRRGSLNGAVADGALDASRDQRLTLLGLLREALAPGAPLVLLVPSGPAAGEELALALRALGYGAAQVIAGASPVEPLRLAAARGARDPAQAALAADVDRALAAIERRLGASGATPCLVVARP